MRKARGTEEDPSADLWIVKEDTEMDVLVVDEARCRTTIWQRMNGCSHVKLRQHPCPKWTSESS